MKTKYSISLFIITICILNFCLSKFSSVSAKDTRAKELKYQYNVLKDDEKYKMEGKMLHLSPSGFMTVDEYEQMSEYKEKSTLKIDIPVIETPSDFKYIPHPTYKIVKYNDPPGGAELSLGKKLFQQKQINAQGIVSPDFTRLVYPAVYYYSDSASVDCDLFVIPLDSDDTNLNKILKASTVKRLPDPILSTDKKIDNYSAFRTLTPVDFSTDGTKLLVKEKLGSSEDGIWQTQIYIYDFEKNTSYDLFAVRDAIEYFWQEYMCLNLKSKRWDIFPLGFDAKNPNRTIVQAYAFTGERPIFLGTWSIDFEGNQSRLVSFDKDFVPTISENGLKVVKEGVMEYSTVKAEEKAGKKEDAIVKKQKKEEEKLLVKDIKTEYKFNVKSLNQDYRDDARNLRKLRSISGTMDSNEIQEAYKKYLEDQLDKDINKTEKLLEKQRKELEKIERKIDKLYNITGETSRVTEDENLPADEEEVDAPTGN